ncbi:uncharacterized protein A4U43_C05F1180 [Asparagus officinalis]|uniref:Uncharacterized GPI-anchored protein At5g19230-like domain-containing protein n=1 Tax=Asparagus officinalis TaxID=4686 RepID=A0A5P1ENG7_ASPOF|nr:uncharacterized protein A4U43_C05F1180 [Asparagus officinalis]
MTFIADTDDKLLEGINSYRTSLNLSKLTTNDNAYCLADEIAKQFKGQPCTNTTGSNTVLGTEEQFPNYPEFLKTCHLNATVTQDAAIMPACVPNLDSTLVLTNFTKSQYSGSLNDSKYVAAGVADEGDWIVVVLSTNTPTGNFETTYTGVSSAVKVDFGYYMFLVFAAFLLYVQYL